MMRPGNKQFNPQRAIRSSSLPRVESARLHQLADLLRDTGNREHKRKPGDFGLTPPMAPRRGKSLYENVGIFSRAHAVDLLQQRPRAGLVDKRWTGEGWPQLVWAVAASGEPLEAQHEGNGCYHGCPMPEADPLAEAVRLRWRLACHRD